MIKLRSFLSLCTVVFFTFTGSYAMSSPKQELTSNQQKDLRLVQQYLNSIKNLTANFTQIDEHGNIQKGSIYLSKPHKMRWEYTHPREIIIYFDNKDMIHYDKKLDQVSYFCSRNDFVNFLAQEKITFDKTDLKVKQVDSDKNSINIKLQKDNTLSNMTLSFSKNPIQLNKLTLVDDSENVIKVLFTDIEQPKVITGSLFEFTNHKYAR